MNKEKLLNNPLNIQKKDGRIVQFNPDKIINAVGQSAERVMIKFTNEENNQIWSIVFCEGLNYLKENNLEYLDIPLMHKLVETALETVNPKVAESYRSYRNYKVKFTEVLNKVYKQKKALQFRGDKENSNTDSALVSTQGSLTYSYLNKEFYQTFFLNSIEREAIEIGYIYIHDMNKRLDTVNCCLFDVANVLKGGFEMGDTDYTEPKTLNVAFDVISDLFLSCASQIYGGFTIPQIDDILEPYAKKSYDKYYNELYTAAKDTLINAIGKITIDINNSIKETSKKLAMEKVKIDFEGGFQGLEMKSNSVSSSRGDYPFITITGGLNTSEFGKMCNIAMFKVHSEGQGPIGKKKILPFPKIVFLYDEELHGEGKILHDVYEAGIDCSSKAMYPDWLSLTGEGYVPSMYKKYGEVISPMGCRAFLSPWYEKGGIHPIDESDRPIFIGRHNIGACTLNLLMIYMKAKEEEKDFYEVLDYYMDMIRDIHRKTLKYLSKMKTSINPVAYCEGGFYGGNLKLDDTIESTLASTTASFGFTALNELEQLHHQKSILEDGNFSLKVMKHINKRIDKYKEEDNYLYAIYGTPAESLCSLQVQQFRKKYGIIKNVSDREYVSNSFHCHVSEDIDPMTKLLSEERFYPYANGGHINYNRYPLGYNKEAIKTLVNIAMKKGMYYGINLKVITCNECGHSSVSGFTDETCPKCGSSDYTQIERMNGYLSMSKIHGDTRLNDGKMAEIADRKSM